MAKTGINIKRCNIGSVEQHNKRTKEYLQGLEKSGKALYFFPELTKNNKSWVNPKYEGKTCAELFEEYKELYKQKVGQAPQLKDRTRVNKKTGKVTTIAGWSPIREGCPPIKEDTTIEDFNPIIEWAHENEIDIIRIDLHFDEGHKDEVSGKTKLNRHAHIVFDWVNPETGKTAKLNDEKMSELQTLLADALKMERGAKKSETNADHIPHNEYREKKAAEHILELKEEEESLSHKIATFEGIKQGVSDLFTGKTRKAKEESDKRAEKAEKENSNLAHRIDKVEKENQELSHRIDEVEKENQGLRKANKELEASYNTAETLTKARYALLNNIDKVLPEATSHGLSNVDAVRLAMGETVDTDKITVNGETYNAKALGLKLTLRWFDGLQMRIGALLQRESERIQWIKIGDWATRVKEYILRHAHTNSINRKMNL